MANQHSATPTPQEIDKFFMLPLGEEERLAAAFCAGADQELEACVEWFQEFYKTESWVKHDLKHFRAARRPKPPSLKDQALAVLDDSANRLDGAHENIIRLALEALPND
jgi:hypothetical protein